MHGSSTVEVELIADLTASTPSTSSSRSMPRPSPSPTTRSCAGNSSPTWRPLEGAPAARPPGSPRCRANRCPSSTSWSRSTSACSTTSPTRSAWSPACRRPEDTLRQARGSCRDTAWLLVQILRHLGLAARFVSGYLVQLELGPEVPGRSVRPADDFTDLHAWCEVFLPGAGWVGLDPTSGLFAGEGHIPLACTPDPGSAAPITGATDPCEVTLRLQQRRSPASTRTRASPCPTPRSSGSRIDALGRRSTRPWWRRRAADDGRRADLRLHRRHGRRRSGTPRRWATHKRAWPRTLLLRLRERFAPGGLLHYGQGKWYPGEALPRWALGCFWRTDGEPLWPDPELLARVDRDYGHDAVDAGRFMPAAVRRTLGSPPEFIHPAYEDAAHYRAQEHALPLAVDPLPGDTRGRPGSQCGSPRVLDHGLDNPVRLRAARWRGMRRRMLVQHALGTAASGAWCCFPAIRRSACACRSTPCRNRPRKTASPSATPSSRATRCSRATTCRRPDSRAAGAAWRNRRRPITCRHAGRAQDRGAHGDLRRAAPGQAARVPAAARAPRALRRADRG